MLRQRWNLPERAVVFAFAGKLIDKKRPLDFIRAVARAQSEEPNLGGLIIGDGPLRSACEQEIKRSGATVRLAGFLNQSEIVAGYCAADALVLPSDGGETWGLVVNEAMACGLPCLVSDHVGCGPDLIANQGTGAIFRLADVEQLAGTMAAWARDGAHVSSMGAQARKLSTSFTPEIAARATFEMCQAIAPTRLRRASSAAV
jgi:glycosyltransferase involved in cell wall biosynthesis